ncbi:MBL fold metallo-hydrolase [Prosthecomicrobium sp. N25]|uniref:MBL fold metallo-hydrolase n=1 Tax=Prosthecomicrobium sp. N25 TaxID=3129254 RepID=UPI0030771AF2
MTDAAEPPFRIAIVPVTPFQQNCSILTETATGVGAVIDPGGDVESILAGIDQLGCRVEKIVLTHGHIDHAGGAAELKERLEARTGATIPIEGPHRAEAPLLAGLPQSAARFGLTGARAVTPDRWLDEGDRLTIGGIGFDVLHCPGHSPGSLVYVQPEARFAFMGDVLFRGSIGRTDLPFGDHATLIRSITEKVLPLGDDLVFLPGHGPMSRIGDERASNPFLR